MMKLIIICVDGKQKASKHEMTKSEMNTTFGFFPLIFDCKYLWAASAQQCFPSCKILGDLENPKPNPIAPAAQSNAKNLFSISIFNNKIQLEKLNCIIN